MRLTEDFDFIVPDWPAPENVKALVTTRTKGPSRGAFAAFNPAAYVNDQIKDVKNCQKRLQDYLGQNHHLCWLKQNHGIKVSIAGRHRLTIADAAVAFESAYACVILTADCLPIFFCDQQGTRIAIAHAGWRGLAQGVIKTTVKALQVPPATLIVWLGPAICQFHYEVGTDVKSVFEQQDPLAADAFLVNSAKPHHYFADLYQLARLKLQALGIRQIYGGNYCTYQDSRFYSWRREQGNTGRMANVIWLT